MSTNGDENQPSSKKKKVTANSFLKTPPDSSTPPTEPRRSPRGQGKNRGHDLPVASTDMDTSGPATQSVPLRNPSSNLVVIFDGIVGVNRMMLRPELVRVAPWLQAQMVDVMRSGGLRVKCRTPADAELLLKRHQFPADAFRGPFTVHRPGSRDPSLAVSSQLERDLRTVTCSRLPLEYTANDLRHIFLPEYVEEIRDVPPQNLNRPPLRIIIMKTKQLRDEVVEKGLTFFNYTVPVRPHRAAVLPLYCRKCCSYGHATIDCKSAHFKCGKCAGQHATNSCNLQQRDAICPNCEGNHFSTYRGCLKFKEAAKTEIEHREARAAEKQRTAIERRNHFAPRSNAPAPVRTGTSFASAVSLSQPQNVAHQAQRQLQSIQRPPPAQTAPTFDHSATQIDLSKLIAMITSIQTQLALNNDNVTRRLDAIDRNHRELQAQVDLLQYGSNDASEPVEMEDAQRRPIFESNPSTTMLPESEDPSYG